MTNAFATYAEATRSTREVRRETAADRRAMMQRHQREQDQLRKEARATDVARLEDALRGPHGETIAALRRRLRTLKLADAPSLIIFVRESSLREASYEVRWLALRLIAHAMTRVRLGAGLPPFDDGLPGDAPKAMAVIKELLGVK